MEPISSPQGQMSIPLSVILPEMSSAALSSVVKWRAGAEIAPSPSSPWQESCCVIPSYLHFECHPAHTAGKFIYRENIIKLTDFVCGFCVYLSCQAGFNI